MSARLPLLLLSLLSRALLAQSSPQVINVRITQSTTTTTTTATASTPVAIYGCKLYDGAGNCLGCTRDQYLRNSACVDVPDANLIPNCNIYASSSSCLECDAGLVPAPDAKTCVAGDPALNCAIFNNSSTCTSCPPGSYSRGTGCIAIPNCAAVFNQTCAICSPNYYPATGAGGAIVCTELSASALVSNCSYYAASQKCAGCASGFALALDGGSCLATAAVAKQVDSNCAETQVNGASVCMLCREGHFLKNGICQTCAASETCLVCDPDAPAVCLLCAPGYFQSAVNGTCLLNVVDTLGQRDPLAEAAGVWTALQAALLLLLVIEIVA